MYSAPKRHTTVLWLFSDSIYAVDEMADALNKYKEFTRLVKKKSHSISEFIAEYDKAHSRAKEGGSEFSDTVLAFNLLESCHLSETDEKFVLTGMDFKSGKEKKNLFTQAKNSLRKFQGREKLVSDDSDTVKVKREEAIITDVKQALIADGWKPPNSNDAGSSSG